MFTVEISMISETLSPKKTAIAAVKNALRNKRYRAVVHENDTELFFVYSDSEEGVVSEAKGMIARLKRRYR
jgi:hypothetical protein